ncbi:hypothetical protein FRC12_018993 [Ceratobasidium sp. 428]|nr:hypothetical protein FRC12_018993 [Ceratobasidium sp. 428]
MGRRRSPTPAAPDPGSYRKGSLYRYHQSLWPWRSLPYLSRRFKLYSSSVRILRSATPYSVNFPDDFPSPDSQPSTALLPPNLERLLVHTHFHTRPYLSWVRRFLVPSLREFRLLPIRVFEEDIEGLELRPESYLELANKVIASSPRIEVLDIYAWEPNALCKSEDHPSPYRYCKHQQLYTRSFKDLWERLILLGQMQTLTTYGLRSLSISIPYICSEFLQSLGALPYLETLQLHIDRNKIQIADKIPIVLSDNSFANLGHLGLYGFHPSMFEQLSSPRAFFRNLTTAVIHIYKLERSDLFNNSEPLSRDVAPVLGQNSPYLIRLAVKHLVTDRSTALRLPLLDAYSHTSLRYLELDTIQMAFRGSSQNTQRAFEWGQLLTVMPHLEELKLRDQEISLQELCAITTMLLRLRLLLLKAVLLNEGLVMPDLVGKPAVVEPITVHCWFQRGQRGWGSGLALGLAKYVTLSPERSNVNRWDPKMYSSFPTKCKVRGT